MSFFKAAVRKSRLAWTCIRWTALALSTPSVVFASTGCAGSTAVISQSKKAYIVKGSVFGTSMYYCQVTITGQPVCTEVREYD
jgi:hypothetical protein